jgi:hypothetical protein
MQPVAGRIDANAAVVFAAATKAVVVATVSYATVVDSTIGNSA